MTTRTLLALGTALALTGLSTAAFAGPGIAPLNEQQYQTSAQETLRPLLKLQRPAAMSQTGTVAAPSDPHWGPAFDPDVQ